MADPIPSTLTAGESLSLDLDCPDFPPAAGWLLRWVLQGPATLRVAQESTPQGDHHRIALSPAQTTPLLGSTPWQLWAVRGDEARIFASGILSVSPGLATATHEERVLASLEQALESLAQDDAVEIEIGDRKLVLRDPAKVQQLIAVFRTKVNAQRGISSFTTLPVRLS